MMTLWKDYFELLMEFEGEAYECVPGDRGGATKFGIDQRSHPDVDIEALTRCGAERIYLAEFGESTASKLPAPISFAYFDLAVNAGERQAAQCLQRAVCVNDDGRVGRATLGAAMAMIAHGESGKLLGRLSAQRDLFYMGLAHTRPSQNKFLNGWLRRSKAMFQWAVARLGDVAAATGRDAGSSHTLEACAPSSHTQDACAPGGGLES
jgi:lysozyme family protein